MSDELSISEQEKRIIPLITNSVEKLDLDGTLSLVKEALKFKIPATKIVLNGLSPGMEKAGKLFEVGTYFLAELVFSAHIMNSCMDILRPLLVKEASKVPVTGKVVIGTVEGDLHDIGKNLVTLMMRTGGFEVSDLGVDVSTEQFVEEVKKTKPDILGMSSFLTTTAPYMEVIIDDLKKAGVLDGLYIMIGGPPTSQAHADDVGAHIWCKDAIVAVEVAKNYMKNKKSKKNN